MARMSIATERRKREWIKADEVAEMLGVSVHTVRSWRLRGSGPPAYRMNAAVRYDRDEVEDWHASKKLPGR